MTTPHKSPPLALTLRGYIQHAPENWRAHMAAAANQVEEVARLREELAAMRDELREAREIIYSLDARGIYDEELAAIDTVLAKGSP